MAVTINIDTGGTFTDGVFTRDGTILGVKAFSTPHDLTVGMLECVDAGASALGIPVEQMLAETEAFRFSSTIVTNAIIERRGPRVGLLVSAGAEQTLYGDTCVLAVAGYVYRDLIAGVREPINPAAVAESVETLLDRGARVLAVSLDGSWRDPSAERAVRNIVRGLYPTYYVGSVRVFLASDISVLPGAQARTNTIVLNALVHDYLAKSVYPAEEKLRRRGMRCPMLLVDGHAGLARSAKTLAIQTHNSGPAAGVSGAAALADSMRVGSGPVVTLDIGGTSSDVSVADAQSLAIVWSKLLDGLPVHVPSVSVDALPYGGGTMASVDNGELHLGPKSAGAYPGPACFDRGGEDATVTDANLLLGLLDAGGFHGGRLSLRLDHAQQALDRLGQRLGLEAVVVARRICRMADAGIAKGVSKVLRRRGARPEEATLVAYGGGGPLHAAAVAGLAGIRHVFVPGMSSVFGALGVSKPDVHHVYPLIVGEDSAAPAFDRLLDAARRDVKAEGFPLESALVNLAVVNRSSGAVLWQHARIALPDAKSVLAGPLDDAVAIARSGTDTLLVLTTTLATARAAEGGKGTENVAADQQPVAGERAVDWGNGTVATAILQCAAVPRGRPVEGPALVASADKTIAVPPGWILTRSDGEDFHLEAKR